MNFRFNLPKATEVACEFLERAGGQVNVMKPVKLVYLLDRLSLDRRGIPVVGGDYLSMRNGPVTSDLLDLINAGRLCGETNSSWEQAIRDRVNHEVKLEAKPARLHLSAAELELVDAIWVEHGERDPWQLVAWCHEHCGEWKPLSHGCAPIAVKHMGRRWANRPTPWLGSPARRRN